MAIRAKMVVTGAFKSEYSDGCKIVFNAQYDEDTPEDKRFQKYTPSANAEFIVDNPAVMEQIVIGRAYYFDITPVPKKEEASEKAS